MLRGEVAEGVAVAAALARVGEAQGEALVLCELDEDVEERGGGEQRAVVHRQVGGVDAEEGGTLELRQALAAHLVGVRAWSCRSSTVAGKPPSPPSSEGAIVTGPHR